MNQNQQVLKNLKRSLILTLGLTQSQRNETRFEKLFEVADCIMSTNKNKCNLCKLNMVQCSDLTRWNDITDEELMRKG